MPSAFRISLTQKKSCQRQPCKPASKYAVPATGCQSQQGSGPLALRPRLSPGLPYHILCLLYPLFLILQPLFLFFTIFLYCPNSGFQQQSAGTAYPYRRFSAFRGIICQSGTLRHPEAPEASPSGIPHNASNRRAPVLSSHLIRHPAPRANTQAHAPR